MEEKGNQNIISFAFVCAGFLGYLLTAVVLEVLAGTFGAAARFRNIPAVQHGLPVTAGIITFLILFLNKKIYTWADECVTEIRKVVWPSRKDTTAMTMVVIVMVLLSGVGLGAMDFISSQLIKLFVNQ